VTTAVLAVDVGGTTMKGAVIDALGRARHAEARATFADGRAALANLQTFLQDLRTECGRLGAHATAAAVVTPGLVDDRTGHVEVAHNLKWTALPLQELLADATGLPVAVGNDARAAGRAEYLLADPRPESFALVPIGTGISAALVLHGRAISGATHAAGEFGHVPVREDGALCACGLRGCLEAYASGSAIIRRYRERGGRRAGTTAAIPALLGRDRVADLVWEDAIEALASGLLSMTMMFDPGVIVIGGGLSHAGDALLAPLRVAVERRMLWRAAPEITRSALGSLAGRTGAAVLAFERAGLGDLVTGWTVAGVMA